MEVRHISSPYCRSAKIPMPTTHFAHGFAFDPTYGYTLETLLQLPPPPEPADFTAFWQGLFAQAQAVRVAPQLQEIASLVPAQRLFMVEYTSLGHFRIKGWLTVPKDEPIERGAVIGHGYGGRDGPDREVPITRCAVLFPCARGLSLSAHPAIPANPARHVLYSIQNRHAYILGGCAADIWCGATALLQLFPAAAARLDYLGISFGGGVGALALPWDERFHSAHLCVPSFGNHPVRLDCPCIGSGEAVRTYHREGGGITLEVLRYFDAASAARYLRIPMHIAAARFDPAVPPPGQFSIYNAIDSPKRLFMLSAGHFDYPDQSAEQRRLFAELKDFFKAA